MLRASSGKHARLVGVCPAGGDSVSAESAAPAICPSMAGFPSGKRVSTSLNIAPNQWFSIGISCCNHRKNVQFPGFLFGVLISKCKGFNLKKKNPRKESEKKRMVFGG